MAHSILEVWDFRLSKGSPILKADGEFWKVEVWANDPGSKDRELLAEHTTDVKTNGDIHDGKGIEACYKWLRSVRDKFKRDHFELRKPIAKLINESNAISGMINQEAMVAKTKGNTNLFHQKVGELRSHLDSANAEIKKLTTLFHVEVAKLGGV